MLKAVRVEEVGSFSLTAWYGLNRPSRGCEFDATWEDLAKTVAEPTDLPDQGKAALRLWSFGTFMEGYRSQKKHISSSGMLIDYDSNAKEIPPGNTTMTRDDLLACWGDLRFLAHTTPSHRPGGARWRVLVLFSRPVDKGEYTSIARWLTDYAMEHGAPGLEKDKTWHNPAQCFFEPARTVHYEYLVNPEGKLLDVDGILESVGEVGAPAADIPGRSVHKASRTTDYGAAALRSKVSAVSEAKAGGRHQQLFKSSASIGELIAGGEVDESDAAAMLFQAAEACELVFDEGERKVRRTIRDGFSKGADSPRSADSEQPEIQVGEGRLAEQVERAEDLLAQPGSGIYQRIGVLVDIQHESAPGRPVQYSISPLGAGAMALTLARKARWFKLISKKDELLKKPADPPVRTVQALLEKGNWSVPTLTGLQHFPTLRPDGTILGCQGYDQETGLYLAVDAEGYPGLKDCPSREDGRAALQDLREVVVDFPFTNEVDRSVALAAMLTPLARVAFSGGTPLFLFDSHTPGSGKSLLADVVAVLATGRVASRMIQEKNEEMRKRITAMVLAGDPVALIDNITHRFGGAAIDAAITGEIWGDRLLGVNETVSLPMNIVFLATGNNVEVDGDLARRTLRCRIDPEHEFPELRDGFKHPQLQQWVVKERARLVVAAITVLRSYILAEKPISRLSSFGSFDGWSSLIRCSLVWLGQPDPVMSQKDLRAEAEPERTSWSGVLQPWYELLGDRLLTASEMLDEAKRGAPSDPDLGVKQRLLGALETMVRGDVVTPRAIAEGVLKKWKGRIVDGYRLAQHPQRKGGGNLWQVVRVDEDLLS